MNYFSNSSEISFRSEKVKVRIRVQIGIFKNIPKETLKEMRFITGFFAFGSAEWFLDTNNGCESKWKGFFYSTRQ